MSKPIIEVRQMSKKYRLGQVGFGTLRDDITSAWQRLRTGKAQENTGQPGREDFWALRDVSFHVQQGEILGIIGPNGAGKSTLLKILSRITEPTSGEAVLRGRVASLLEVGTGFNPELTGRENVYMNGTILGMKKREITSKLDEIIAFAEIERHIDTPVKRYSSGMYVRLAFAVAAHLEPEILIVDEVLAVGDAEFQKKCLGKMQDVSKRQGRTILFVSHNARALQTLCTSSLLLKNGRIEFSGPISEALNKYSAPLNKHDQLALRIDPSRPSISRVKVDIGELEKGNLVVDVSFTSPIELNVPVAGIIVTSMLGTPVFGSNCRFHSFQRPNSKLKEGTVRLVVNQLPMHAGWYKLSVFLSDWYVHYDEHRDLIAFEFKKGKIDNHMPNAEDIGFIDVPGQWYMV